MQYMSLMRVFVSAVIFFSFFWISFERIDPDFWWHLKIGEWILSEGAAPRADLWSATMPSERWVDHEWLLEAFMAFAWDRFGWGALAAFFALLVSLPFFLWIARARGALELAFLALAAIFISDFVGVRPQTISFVFFVVLFELVTRAFSPAGATRARRLIFITPCMFLLWSNLHAGFFSGLMLLGVIGVVRFVAAAHEKGFVAAARKFGGFTAVLLASVLATFVNPYGPGLYAEIFSVASSPLVGRYVIEWQSILRVPFFASWALLLGVVGFFLIRFWRAYPHDLRAAAIVFLAGFLKSAKLGPLFLASAVPLVRQGLREAAQTVAVPRAPHPLIAKWGARAVLGVSLVWLFGVAALSERAPLPKQAVAFLRTEAGTGRELRLFHEYRWGGYLLYAAPEIKTFIDGRMPHWQSKAGPSPMEDYVAVFYGEGDAWREVFARRGIDTALIPQGVSGERSPQEDSVRARRLAFWFGRYTNDLRAALLEAGWTAAYEDEIAVVLRCRPLSCVD